MYIQNICIRRASHHHFLNFFKHHIFFFFKKDWNFSNLRKRPHPPSHQPTITSWTYIFEKEIEFLGIYKTYTPTRQSPSRLVLFQHFFSSKIENFPIKKKPTPAAPAIISSLTFFFKKEMKFQQRKRNIIHIRRATHSLILKFLFSKT